MARWWFTLLYTVCEQFFTWMVWDVQWKASDYYSRGIVALDVSAKQTLAKEAAEKIFTAMGKGLDYFQKYLGTYGGMYLDFKNY